MDELNNLQKAVFKFLPQNAPETVLQSVVRSINLIARTIGYLKNVAFAVLFGFSYQTDGLFIALSLLGIFLIFADVFDSLGVPQLVKARMQSEQEFKNLAGLLFTFTLALGLLVLAIVPIDLVLRIPAGFSSQAPGATKSSYVLLIPYLFSKFTFHHFGLRSQRRFTYYFVGELVISIANLILLVLGYYLVKDFRVIPASISLAHMLGALYMLYVGRESIHLRLYADEVDAEEMKKYCADYFVNVRMGRI